MPAIVSTTGLGGRLGIGVATVRRRTEAMLFAVGKEAAVVSILLCNDDKIAELNGRYRGKAKPTDVLSFGMTGDPADGGETFNAPPLEPGEPELLGDIVISIPTAARQARPASALREEVTRLLAHGLLHLIGWTHSTRTERQAMDAETERLIAAANARSSRHGTT